MDIFYPGIYDLKPVSPGLSRYEAFRGFLCSKLSLKNLQLKNQPQIVIIWVDKPYLPDFDLHQSILEFGPLPPVRIEKSYTV